MQSISYPRGCHCRPRKATGDYLTPPYWFPSHPLALAAAPSLFLRTTTTTTTSGTPSYHRSTAILRRGGGGGWAKGGTLFPPICATLVIAILVSASRAPIGSPAFSRTPPLQVTAHAPNEPNLRNVFRVTLAFVAFGVSISSGTRSHADETDW